MDAFTKAYIEAALYFTSDDNGDNLDKNYNIHDISPEAIESIINDCTEFQAKYGRFFTENTVITMAVRRQSTQVMIFGLLAIMMA